MRSSKGSKGAESVGRMMKRTVYERSSQMLLFLGSLRDLRRLKILKIVTSGAKILEVLRSLVVFVVCCK